MRLRDIASAVRVELLEPMAQRPSRRYLLQLTTTATQSYYNEISQSGRPWSAPEVDLQVVSGVNDYVVPAADIGHILDVTTKDLGNPAHIERPVPFWDLAELRSKWNAPRNAQWATFYDSTHTAQRIAFYRKDFNNETWAQVWPVPQAASVYRILYSQIGDVLNMALDDEVFLPQHNHLITTQTALDALPGSAWYSNEVLNQARRKELEASLLRRLPVYTDQFRRAIRSMTKMRNTQRVVYSID